MKQYRSSAQLKDLAKRKLEGHYSGAVLTMFLLQMIRYGVSALISLFFPMGNTFQILLSAAASFIASVFTGILSAGTACYFLGLACGGHVTPSDLFYGFREQRDAALSLSAVFSLLSFVCTTPYQLFCLLLFSTGQTLWLVLALLCMAAGLAVYVPVSLSLSQCFYLLLDFPGQSWREVIRSSRRIMRGSLGRLFYVQLSFLPLTALCLLSCGIGFLWLVPYINMTYALFYLDLMNPAPVKTPI